MKTQQQRTNLSNDLFAWATLQHMCGMSVNGFNIDTCNRSGSIWFQRDSDDACVYLNYDWDGCGDVLNGHTGNESKNIRDVETIADIDCSGVETFEALVALYIATVKRITEAL